MPPVLYLVDASVFIFRAYYSVPLEFTDRDGNPVNAVHGFARFLGDLLEKQAPTHIAVAFDESLEQSYRNEIYPAYKANREPAPPELKRQFGLCREVVRAFGLAEFGSSRYEADDIIGTLATRARAAGRPVTIVSRDKDLTQLIGAHDTYWDAVADVRYGYDDIEERFGVRPERMADFLALMGDAVDNIPGVPGVGRKTAATLLKHYDTLPGVYDNLDCDPEAQVPRRHVRRAEPAASTASRRSCRGSSPASRATCRWPRRKTISCGARPISPRWMSSTSARVRPAAARAGAADRGEIGRKIGECPLFPARRAARAGTAAMPARVPRAADCVPPARTQVPCATPQRTTASPGHPPARCRSRHSAPATLARRLRSADARPVAHLAAQRR